jgi:hypothetical protein
MIHHEISADAISWGTARENPAFVIGSSTPNR